MVTTFSARTCCMARNNAVRKFSVEPTVLRKKEHSNSNLWLSWMLESPVAIVFLGIVLVYCIGLNGSFLHFGHPRNKQVHWSSVCNTHEIWYNLNSPLSHVKIASGIGCHQRDQWSFD